ncbi:MAG: GDP-L-fucose synthase family protein [Caulobacteraceae bacterium]
MIRALVTGANGLVGNAVVDELRSDGGYEVIAVSRSDVDLRSADATTQFFERRRPDVVFHLAAKVGGLGGNLAAPGLFFYENVLINTNVIEASRIAGARKVVAMGSSACYSDAIKLPMAESDIWDGPPHGSEAAYAHSKRSMLAQLEAYNLQYGMDYAYCIATNMFGPNDKFDETHGHVLPSLISKFHRGVNQGAKVTVWGTGTPKRDFLYSKDVGRFLRVIAEQFTGSINVASGEVVTIRELVESIRKVSGFTGAVDWDVSKPNGQEMRGYDIRKLKSLGLIPMFDLEVALRETYEWFCQNVNDLRR